MCSGLCAVCEKPAYLKCARCLSVYYCGKDHQRENWAEHQKTNCLSYKVKSFRNERYVVTTRDIKKGEIILTENPLVLGSENDSCPGCLRPLPENRIYVRCALCKWPVCSRLCSGLKDPLYHGAECQVLSAIKSSFFMHSMKALLPLRCLLLQRSDPEKWRALHEMAYSAEKQWTRTSKGEGYFFLIEAILKPLAKKAPYLLPPKRSATVLGRIVALVGAFGVRLKQPSRGNFIAVLPVTSLMQHSCLPNTVLTFEGPSNVDDLSQRRSQVVVRAAEDIEKGKKFSACFVNLFESTVDRQKTLAECRGFLCFCERCLDPTELGTNLSTLKCEDCSGSILPLDTEHILLTYWKCKGPCGNLLTSEEAEEKLYDAFVLRPDSRKYRSHLTFIEAVKDRVDKHLHPHNVHFLYFKRTYIQFFVERIANDLVVMSELKEGADFCREMLKVLVNRCLVAHTYDIISEVLLSLSRINSEIAKRKEALKELDLTGASLAKKYCVELKLLSHRFADGVYTQCDVQSLQGADIRLKPF